MPRTESKNFLDEWDKTYISDYLVVSNYNILHVALIIINIFSIQSKEINKNITLQIVNKQIKFSKKLLNKKHG